MEKECSNLVSNVYCGDMNNHCIKNNICTFFNRALAGHINCTLSYTANCPADAQVVYKELNQLFLNAWCTPSQILSNSCKGVESLFSSSILSLIIALALVRVHGYFV